jgi:predicted nucleic acid-binding Zn ribbon protein
MKPTVSFCKVCGARIPVEHITCALHWDERERLEKEQEEMIQEQNQKSLQKHLAILEKYAPTKKK